MDAFIYKVDVVAPSSPFKFDLHESETIIGLQPLHDRLEVWISGNEDALLERQKWVLEGAVA